jgi:hypothetical protein
MRICIDEAGGFVFPQSGASSFSLVLALSIPSAIEAELFYEFLRLRDTWPEQAVEIKGSTLSESHAAQVIELVRRYDVLVNFRAIDMATHDDQVVDDFRICQANEVTAHLTPEHHPKLTAQLQSLADMIRSMPNQLFLQAFLTIDLLFEVIRETTLYYVQRKPSELGEIAWAIDRKDRTITKMEEVWTALILPVSEGRFARDPMGALAGADYSYFHTSYGAKIDPKDAELARHLAWQHETFGTPRRPTAGKTVVKLKVLLTDRREFLDSRDSLGLQLTDMLAAILRRALNGRLQPEGWSDFGQLNVRRSSPGSSFVQLGRAPNAPETLKGTAKTVGLALDARGKSMLIDD